MIHVGWHACCLYSLHVFAWLCGGLCSLVSLVSLVLHVISALALFLWFTSTPCSLWYTGEPRCFGFTIVLGFLGFTREPCSWFDQWAWVPQVCLVPLGLQVIFWRSLVFLGCRAACTCVLPVCRLYCFG